MRYFLITLFVLLLIFSLSHPAFSQWEIEAGAGYDVQHGIFTAPCACTYLDGSGYALTSAISYDLTSSHGFTVGVQAGVDFKQWSSAHNWTSPGQPVLRDSANISQTYLTFEPYLRYKLPEIGLFFQVAPTIEKMVASHFYQRKYSIEKDSVWENGPLENTASVRYAARISSGYQFGAFGLDLAPTFTIDIPLSSIRSADASDLRASSWSLTTTYFSLGVFF